MYKRITAILFLVIIATFSGSNLVNRQQNLADNPHIPEALLTKTTKTVKVVTTKTKPAPKAVSVTPVAVKLAPPIPTASTAVVTSKPVTLRIKIVANDIAWDSLPSQVSALEQWFSVHSENQVTIVCDVVHTEFTNVPFISYNVPGDPSIKGVDYGWYDKNVTSLATNYDMVIFLMPIKDWQEPKVRGWRTDNDQGPVEIQVAANENEINSDTNYLEFVDFSRHEITHGLFLLTGQTDRTHEFWFAHNFEHVLDVVDFKKLATVKLASIKN